MTTEQIEQLVQKVVDEVMKKIQSTEHRHETLVALSLGEQQKIPKNVLEMLQTTLVFSEEIDSSDLLLVAELSVVQLSALANLQAIDLVTQSIVEGLFKKKSVFVFSTNVSIKELRQQTRFGLWRQFNEVIEKLESFGIYLIQSEEMLNTRLHQESMRKKRQTLD